MAMHSGRGCIGVVLSASILNGKEEKGGVILREVEEGV